MSILTCLFCYLLSIQSWDIYFLEENVVHRYEKTKVFVGGEGVFSGLTHRVLRKVLSQYSVTYQDFLRLVGV